MDWLVDHVPMISGLDGIVELAVAIVILVGVHRRTGRIPGLAWIVASYFLVEAGVSFNRMSVFSDPDGSLSRVVVLEMLGTLVIIVMLVNARRIAGVIARVVDEARLRADEYERARRDYTQVVRHRINNPLTILKGAAQTLDATSLDDATRHELRLAIIEAAERLESISLEPTRGGAEEYELDAIPHVSEGGLDAPRG